MKIVGITAYNRLQLTPSPITEIQQVF